MFPEGVLSFWFCLVLQKENHGQKKRVLVSTGHVCQLAPRARQNIQVCLEGSLAGPHQYRFRARQADSTNAPRSWTSCLFASYLDSMLYQKKSTKDFCLQTSWMRIGNPSREACSTALAIGPYCWLYPTRQSKLCTRGLTS